MYFSYGTRLTILFAWVVFILVMLLTPMPYSGEDDNLTLIDKAVHAVLFGVLTFLIYFLLRKNNEAIILNPNRKNVLEKTKKSISTKIKFNPVLRIFLIATIFSTCLSMLMEYLQLYVPGRSTNDLDFLASIVGIVLTLIFIYGAEYYKQNHK